MRGPDGAVYEMAKEFVEVVPPERIVFQHQRPIHRFQMTMTFAVEAWKTRLTWIMRFEAAEPAEVRAMIVQANEQNFEPPRGAARRDRVRPTNPQQRTRAWRGARFAILA